MPSSNNLHVAVISLDITWCDPDENRYAVESALSKIPEDTDLAVLPELFTSGYVSNRTSIDDLSEYWEDSLTLKFLKKCARTHNLALCGTFMIKATGGRVLNRCVFVEPSGEVTHYDKHHLFTLSDEAKHFEAGTSRIPVVRYRGWNIAMAVCYDLRFPAWLRNIDSQYDLLVIPAAWPPARSYAWEHLLKARAIENQSYVIGADRSGVDDYGTYDNMSHIVDCMGRDISESNDSSNRHIITATLDSGALTKLRRHFPVLDDADRFRF